MKDIILLNGLPRSGKDTFADYLVDNYNYKKLSFAYILKDILATSLDISIETLEDFKNDNVKIRFHETNGYNEELMNFRKFLQRFGTEGMKPYFGNNVWAELVYKQIKESKHDKFIISDFRFMCEYIEGDYNIKSVLIKDKRELPLEGHSSDIELYKNNFNFDIIIENIGTLEEYYNKIDNLSIF